MRFISLRMRQPQKAENLVANRCSAVSIAGGCGRHVGTVDPSSVIVTLKTILPLEALYGVVMSLVKTSIMLFYYNIFGTKRSFKLSVMVVMTIVWLWAISVALETLLLCRPLAFNWDTSIDGKCGQRNATYVVAGTLNLVTDLMVMVLPLPHLWKLKLNMAKKLALTSVFSMGLLVSVISIVRLSALMAIDFNDVTYSLPMGVLWTVLEPELAIICANMPILKPILSRMFPRFFSSTRQKSYGVSDPQAFERLDEREYSLGQVSRDHLAPTSTAGDEESRDSDQQRLRDHAQDPSGISVVQNFDVQYNHK
ncbi:hypothetical protein BDW74DRAFT_186999 [Aspergillus multicolor]|uniref:uncharacterized protein n=1 Tax=Aspergillus multicolor TaxID=41759 RepID=UPI003CCE09A9